MVIFSSAPRKETDESNLRNLRLSKSAEMILDAERSKVVIVAEWQVGQQLRTDNYRIEHVIALPQDGSRLDNRAVWEVARPLLQQVNITKVIPVANPLLQMRLVSRMITKDGFEVDKRPIGIIGFYKSPLNSQHWTRSASGF